MADQLGAFVPPNFDVLPQFFDGQETLGNSGQFSARMNARLFEVFYQVVMVVAMI